MIQLIYSIGISFFEEIISRIKFPFRYKKIREIRIEKLMDLTSPLDLELIEYYIKQLRSYEIEISIQNIKSKTDMEIEILTNKEMSLYREYISNQISLENRDAKVLFYYLVLEDLENRNVISSKIIDIYSATLLILGCIMLYKLLIYIVLELKDWLVFQFKQNNNISITIKNLLNSAKHFIDDKVSNDVNFKDMEDNMGFNGFVGFVIPFIAIPSIILVIIYEIYKFIRIDIILGLLSTLYIFSSLIYRKKRMHMIFKDKEKEEFINQQLLALTKETLKPDIWIGNTSVAIKK